MRAACSICFLWVMGILLAGCFGGREISSENLSSLYRQEEQLFHPEFSVFHFTADSSTLFVKFDTEELLKVRQSEAGFKAALRLQCKLVESYESAVLLDSVSADFIVDPLAPDSPGRSRLFTIDFRIPKSGSFLLSCTLVDVNKNVSEEFFIHVDHEGKQSRHHFFVSSNQPDVPLFRNYLALEDTFHVRFYDAAVQKLFVSYYHRHFPLAPPPFSFDMHEDFDYTPDSTFTVANDFSNLNFPGEGFYHFQVDTNSIDGLTLFRFKGGFPSVTTPDQMIEATRYLTSRREFEEITTAASKKAAVDKFWLNIGDHPDRTRLLIKKYYSRIRESNRMFSCHTEGWRSDRGMIYIVFGAPNFVYKSSVSESWIYGQPNNALSLNFFFTKVNNPFTDNDFMLSRAPVYESSWYRAVDYWRQGRVYNDF